MQDSNADRFRYPNISTKGAGGNMQLPGDYNVIVATAFVVEISN